MYTANTDRTTMRNQQINNYNERLSIPLSVIEDTIKAIEYLTMINLT